MCYMKEMEFCSKRHVINVKFTRITTQSRCEGLIHISHHALDPNIGLNLDAYHDMRGLVRVHYTVNEREI